MGVILVLDRAEFRIIRSEKGCLEFGFEHICFVRIRTNIRASDLLENWTLGGLEELTDYFNIGERRRI